MKLCSCITEGTAEDCIKIAKALDTELVEHRMDFMSKIENLDVIYDAIKAPVIATNRSVVYGGHFKGNDKERIDYLLKAIDAGYDMVDIEIETKEELKQKVLKKARENNCKVIISMHDFKKTPSMEKMLEIMHKEKEQGADIGKVVTFANSTEDCHRILYLLLEAKKKKFPLVAFAMGKLGRFTRIAALLYGAPFTYASVGRKAGSGQLSVTAMRKVMEELVK